MASSFRQHQRDLPPAAPPSRWTLLRHPGLSTRAVPWGVFAVPFRSDVGRERWRLGSVRTDVEPGLGPVRTRFGDSSRPCTSPISSAISDATKRTSIDHGRQQNQPRTRPSVILPVGSSRTSVVGNTSVPAAQSRTPAQARKLRLYMGCYGTPNMRKPTDTHRYQSSKNASLARGNRSLKRLPPQTEVRGD
jgi:hypothetical protein